MAKPVVWERLAEQLELLPQYEQLPLLDLLEKHARQQEAVRRGVRALLKSDDRIVANRAREFLGE